jgi:hypothetical protein
MEMADRSEAKTIQHTNRYHSMKLAHILIAVLSVLLSSVGIAEEKKTITYLVGMTGVT